MEELEYWKKRCGLAEMYIEESLCDPDITARQFDAYNSWNDFKNCEHLKCCDFSCNESVHKEGSVYCKFHASM